MKVILCLDENGGMLFNGRRQSRDKNVTADIIADLNDAKLYISPFSKVVFEQYPDKVIVDENFLEKIAEDGVCFAEERLPENTQSIKEITVYRWNRVYPADMYCNIDFSKFVLVCEKEFKGNSHTVITKQVFKNTEG